CRRRSRCGSARSCRRSTRRSRRETSRASSCSCRKTSDASGDSGASRRVVHVCSGCILPGGRMHDLPAQCVSAVRAVVRRTMLVAALTAAMAAPAAGLPTPGRLEDSIVVRLRTGALTLSPATTSAFLGAAQAHAYGVVGIAQFTHLLSTAERAALARRGLTVVSFIGGNTYRVRASRALAADTLVRRLLRGMALLRPQDRVVPK